MNPTSFDKWLLNVCFEYICRADGYIKILMSEGKVREIPMIHLYTVFVKIRSLISDVSILASRSWKYCLGHESSAWRRASSKKKLNSKKILLCGIEENFYRLNCFLSLEKQTKKKVAPLDARLICSYCPDEFYKFEEKLGKSWEKSGHPERWKSQLRTFSLIALITLTKTLICVLFEDDYVHFRTFFFRTDHFTISLSDMTVNQVLSILRSSARNVTYSIEKKKHFCRSSSWFESHILT